MNTWDVRLTETCMNWFQSLTDEEQQNVLAMIEVLEIKGPQLSRPYADTLKGTSKIKHLKELIIQHAGKPYRVFYAFDPYRRAILLCGGRKDGAKDKRFYQHMIRLAEKEFLNYLNTEPLTQTGVPYDKVTE